MRQSLHGAYKPQQSGRQVPWCVASRDKACMAVQNIGAVPLVKCACFPCSQGHSRNIAPNCASKPWGACCRALPCAAAAPLHHAALGTHAGKLPGSQVFQHAAICTQPAALLLDGTSHSCMVPTYAACKALQQLLLFLLLQKLPLAGDVVALQ